MAERTVGGAEGRRQLCGCRRSRLATDLKWPDARKRSRLASRYGNARHPTHCISDGGGNTTEDICRTAENNRLRGQHRPCAVRWNGFNTPIPKLEHGRPVSRNGRRVQPGCRVEARKRLADAERLVQRVAARTHELDMVAVCRGANEGEAQGVGGDKLTAAGQADSTLRAAAFHLTDFALVHLVPQVLEISVEVGRKRHHGFERRVTRGFHVAPFVTSAVRAMSSDPSLVAVPITSNSDARSKSPGVRLL